MKVIEDRFIIDLKDKLGTGSFGDVFRGKLNWLKAYDKMNPSS